MLVVFDGLDVIDFGVQCDVKLVIDTLLYMVGKSDDVGGLGVVLVDQNQRLAFIDSSSAEFFAFQSALLNEPCSRNLDGVFIDDIMRNCGIGESNVLIDLDRHNGVLEKTAGTAKVLGFGQLGTTNGDNSVSYGLGRRRGC